MDFNDDAELDTSQVEDIRGSGGGGGGIGLGGLVGGGVGGIGVIGLILYFVLSQLGGGSSGGGLSAGGLSGLGNNSAVDSGNLAGECKTGKDADRNRDCALVAEINSIQGFWSDQFARSGSTYQPAKTRFFRGSVRTGCGSASSEAGPFYCPGDKYVYIDTSFFDQLGSQFGAHDSPFVEAYVLAHEYGHHVQDLLGTEAKVRTRSGPTSDSVRLELQADCYAGVWANHATTTPTANGGAPLISDITEQDVANAVDTAGRIGDDFIQTHLGGGRADPSSYTHGTSAQREKWLTTGLQTGDPARCNTFSTQNLG